MLRRKKNNLVGKWGPREGGISQLAPKSMLGSTGVCMVRYYTLNRSCQIKVQYRIYPNNPLFPRHYMRVWDIENSSNALVTMWGRNHDGAAEPSSAGFVAYSGDRGERGRWKKVSQLRVNTAPRNCTLPRRPALRTMDGGGIA